MSSKDGEEYRDPDTRDALARYRRRYAEFARSPDTLGWRPGTQEIRFAAFYAGFDVIPCTSVLDIGCGFADLLAFLRSRGWQGDYVGIDIVPEFVEEARNRFAGEANARFACLDFMDCGESVLCDAVFASGLLNHRRHDHATYVARFIGAAAKAGRHYVAVDFLSETADRRREDLSYHSAAQMLEAGLVLTKRAALDHAYMPFEFMLKLWFPDSFRADLPAF